MNLPTHISINRWARLRVHEWLTKHGLESLVSTIQFYESPMWGRTGVVVRLRNGVRVKGFLA